MGMTPAKQFPMPTPFGSSPVNNVSQVQPLALNQGPGFAASSGADQTAQMGNPSFSVPMQQATMPMIARGDTNPFFRLLNQ